MNTTETSLRVRFAKAMGYQLVGRDSGDFHLLDARGQIIWTDPDPSTSWKPTRWETCEHMLPNPTDANTVREAMMGMTEGEWLSFSSLLASQFNMWGATHKMVITLTLKTPPTTLAELICEVRNV